MRYTLRLLTNQQFQRALCLILALEQIRKWDDKYNLGDKEITIGLYVGSNSLPNKKEDLVKEATKWNNRADGDNNTKIPIDRCPWCGSKLEYAEGGFCCSNPDCSFMEEIPVRLCDEDIYNDPPTLLFGTVDKFASIAHKVSTSKPGDDSRRLFGKGKDWDDAVAYWKTLKSDDDAVFDKEITFKAEDIVPRITYGTNPGAGIPIDGRIPTLDNVPEADRIGFLSQLEYMQFSPGETLEGHPIDYVFLGACTNGRIEDFRAFASIVKGKKKADGVVAWLVPGSWLVRKQIIEEGIDKILEEAGFELRLPSCSSCLAMNPDKVPAGKLSISTSNRNFVGRQGPGARTVLCSPLTAAASAITGVITDPRKI